MNHLHTKPFNLEHAKEGAPYGLVCGEEVTILKWDARYENRPLLGVYGKNDRAIGWDASGSGGSFGPGYDLVMLPLGYCERKPVFVGDELIDPAWEGDDKNFIIRAGHIPGYAFDRCEWPKPAPTYPQTRMITEQLVSQFMTSAPIINDVTDLANAAIARAIEDGDVFTDDQVSALIEEIGNVINENNDVYKIRHEFALINISSVLKGAKP